MNDLVYLKTEEAMTDSLTVAESFGKRHDHVIRKIEQLKNDCPQKWGECFNLTRYKDPSGKWNPRYLMNRDGFSLLVMGFTGKKALEWKIKYIDAFNKMESVVSQRRTSTWVETRKTGLITRKAETDIIKKLVGYSKEQGSTHSDKLYITYTRLANKAAGIDNGRDTATVEQLNMLRIYEGIALGMIRDGMAAGQHYKDIYQNTKKRFSQVQELAYLT